MALAGNTANRHEVVNGTGLSHLPEPYWNLF